MGGEIGGEAMRRGGRVQSVEEQILVCFRERGPGANPRFGDVGERYSVLRAVGWISDDVVEQIIGVEVVHLETEILQRGEIAEHGLVERLREAAGEILPSLPFGPEVRGLPQIRHSVKQEVVRAEREQRLDGVNRVGLGLSDGRADGVDRDLAGAE